jgi:predicted Fe-Mo cluster-binding NifX family protein
MKIAVITDDSKTISQHFGRAPYYLVVTVEDNKIVDRELRNKLGHSQFSAEGHHQEKSGEQHGFGPEADHRHGRMAEAIIDCEVVICGGMGRGAYESMKARNIRPVVTDIIDLEEAILAYTNEQIIDQVERLH